MSNEIIAGLKALKLHGMAQSYADVTAQARHSPFSPGEFMHQLITISLGFRLLKVPLAVQTTTFVLLWP